MAIRDDSINPSFTHCLRLTDIVLSGKPQDGTWSCDLEKCHPPGRLFIDHVWFYPGSEEWRKEPEWLSTTYRQESCSTCDELMLKSLSAGGDRLCRQCQREERRAAERKASMAYRIRHGLKKTPESTQCAECGATFSPKRSTAKYCSSYCRVRAHRNNPFKS